MKTEFEVKSLPTVRFQYAWLLTEAASTHLNEKFGDGTPLRTYVEYVAITKQYDAWWQPHSEKILQGLCDITGLEFKQNTIDVYVAPWFYAFSSPMVLGVTFESEDALVNALTHEIIHRLLTDNTSHDLYHDYLSDWRVMFGDTHSQNTLVHIPVHAVMQKLYEDVLHRPELVDFDKKLVAENEDYRRAWSFVEEHGHQSIINAVKEKNPPLS